MRSQGANTGVAWQDAAAAQGNLKVPAGTLASLNVDQAQRAAMEAQLDALQTKKRKPDHEDLQGGQDEGNEENEDDGNRKQRRRDKAQGPKQPKKGKSTGKRPPK